MGLGDDMGTLDQPWDISRTSPTDKCCCKKLICALFLEMSLLEFRLAEPSVVLLVTEKDTSTQVFMFRF